MGTKRLFSADIPRDLACFLLAKDRAANPVKSITLPEIY